ncbi:MAG: hypothetical protein M9930_07385, partial [Anaerolineae bacterium]|nr:hypothetical protein [Anaerolineae bacterium]
MKWRLLIFTAVVSCAGLLLLLLPVAAQTPTPAMTPAVTATVGEYAAFDGKTYSTCATATPVPTPTPRPTYTPQPTYTPPPATLAQIPKAGWSVTYVDSEEPGDWASRVFDGSPWTNWHTAWSGSAPPHPH